MARPKLMMIGLVTAVTAGALAQYYVGLDAANRPEGVIIAQTAPQTVAQIAFALEPRQKAVEPVLVSPAEPPRVVVDALQAIGQPTLPPPALSPPSPAPENSVTRKLPAPPKMADVPGAAPTLDALSVPLPVPMPMPPAILPRTVPATVAPVRSVLVRRAAPSRAAVAAQARPLAARLPARSVARTASAKRTPLQRFASATPIAPLPRPAPLPRSAPPPAAE